MFESCVTLGKLLNFSGLQAFVGVFVTIMFTYPCIKTVQQINDLKEFDHFVIVHNYMMQKFRLGLLGDSSCRYVAH